MIPTFPVLMERLKMGDVPSFVPESQGGGDGGEGGGEGD